MILRKFNMIQQMNGFRNKFRHIDGEKMRLSYSIKKNIFEAAVGGLINKFKFRKRRDTLFFVDILMNYVKECEKAGYEEEIRNVSEKWALCFFHNLMPPIMKKLPFDFLCNKMIAPNFKNLGYVEDIKFVKENDNITIITKNETNIEKIGLNGLSIGFYMGMLDFICNSKVDYINATKSDETCTYVFRLTKNPISIQVKDKATYDKLNYLPPTKGFTLKDALEKGIFQLKEHNQIYFRGKLVSPAEPTILHLIGSKSLMLEKISDISFKYFKDILDESSTYEEKLRFLKTILQVIGWGIINIIIKSSERITIEIKRPPHGFQLGEENWIVFDKIILGYLWVLNKKYKTLSMKFENNKLSLVYVINKKL